MVLVLRQKWRRLLLRLPAGSYDGMVLRFRNGGYACRNGTPSGDFICGVEVEASICLREGVNDIYSETDIEILWLFSVVILLLRLWLGMLS